MSGVRRDDLVAYLDRYLRIDQMEDGSWNGLQVEGASRVERLAVAVDGCLETIRRLKRRKAEMLIVHHGLFWGRGCRVVGPDKARIAGLLEADVSLYAAHLPLDVHAEVGNNVVILRGLGIEGDLSPFGYHRRRQAIGWSGTLPEPRPLAELASSLDALLDTDSVLFQFGRDRVRTVGVITGSGAFALEEVADLGIDLFITGDWDHSKYHTARERKLNVVTAGHYKTETVGVKALAVHLAEKYGLSWGFIDVPTGL